MLNTGEIISIDKEVRYSIKGQPGNPLDMSYSPDYMESISFKYNGRDYFYKTDAGIIVLAISPQKLPVLIGHTGRGWGYRNNYPLCNLPNYVQFVPDDSGKIWKWPNKIESWTYNLPANLMSHRDHPSKIKNIYTIADKAQIQNYLKDPRLINSQKINPFAKDDNCTKK